MGIAYYDSELITMAANESGYSEEYVRENEQKLPNTLLYDLYTQYYSYGTDEQSSPVLLWAELPIIYSGNTKTRCMFLSARIWSIRSAGLCGGTE